MTPHALSRNITVSRELGIASGTKVVKQSRLAYWRGFYRECNVDTRRVRALGAHSEEAAALRLKKEFDTLSAFSEFIVFVPHTRAGKRLTNSVNYA